jgi:hypothetical protein
MTRLFKLFIGWVLLAVAAAVLAQIPPAPNSHSCFTRVEFDGTTYVSCTTETYTNHRLWFDTTDPSTQITTSATALFWRDSFGHSDTTTPAAPTRQVRIAHINGIATTRDGALANLDEIMARVIETSSFLCSPVRRTLAYNRSRPDPLLGTPVNDLMEVAVQKHRENPNTRFSDMVRLVYLADTGATWLARTNIPLAVVHAVLEALDAWYQQANTWVDSDLRDISADIRPHLVRGERVLLVPHSQGNLFANMVMASLGDTAPDPRALRQLGIASPAASVQNGRYLSSVNDTVLRKLALVADVLPLNLDIPSDGLAHTLDPRGHNLIDIYLHPELPGLDQIRSMASTMLEEMIGSSESDVLAQCQYKAMARLWHFQNTGAGCYPTVQLGATPTPEGVASHGLYMWRSPPHSSVRPLMDGVSGAPGDALRQLAQQTQLMGLDGRWRVARTDIAGHTLERTQNGQQCYLHQGFIRYWAFVFDTR